MTILFSLLFAAAAAIIAAAAPVHARDLKVARKGIVDGSGWEGTYSLLRKEGFNVSPVLRPVPSRWRPVASPRDGQCCG
jgi:hypothetical protein